MGIRGFQRFVSTNRLFTSHRLHSTPLVIDGMNLEYELYQKYLQSHNDYAFGGDYSHLSAYFRSFFETLLACDITPIVVMDGSFDSDQLERTLEKKRSRFDDRLKSAYSVYQGRAPVYEGIHSLFNADVFVQVIKSLGIRNYTAIAQPDSIIPQIGYDLNCPILSNDSEFLVMNLPGGVATVESLVKSDFKVMHDFEKGFKYLNCKLYRVNVLIRQYPGLKLDLLHLSSGLLGNYRVNYLVLENLIKKMDHELKGRGAKVSDRRQFQIITVFKWISNFATYEQVDSSLIALCDGDPKHEAVQNVQNCHRLRLVKGERSKILENRLTVEQYFESENIFEYLFKPEPDVPEWAHHRFLEGRFQKRLVSIYKARFELFRPLVDDFSLDGSSYECIFELSSMIYGILRCKDSGECKPVTRFVRKCERRAIDQIEPVLEFKGKRLPSFSQIGSMSLEERTTLFFKLLQLDQSILDNVVTLFADAPPEDTKLDQLGTMILGMVYLSRKFEDPIWIEFYYALLVNILLMGNFGRFPKGHIPKVINDSGHDNLLTSKLTHFDRIPVIAFDPTPTYKPRVVHFYNAFQNCLQSICFLAQILDLSHLFHLDQLILGIQGTFIYNLALDLGSRDAPLFYLEQDLLKNFAHLDLFKGVLDLVLKNCDRKYTPENKKEEVDRNVVPIGTLMVNKFEATAHDRAFVRGLKEVKVKKEFVKLDDLSDLLGSIL